MTAAAPVGVAVIGLGIGEQHARAFAADPRATVRWLHDLDPERALALSRALPGARPSPGIDAILADPGTGIVSIASFDQDHFGQAMAALAAGKHVFVEKPLCRNQDELAQLKQRWMESGGRLKLGSNLILRAAPLYRWLKGRIEAGELGRLYALDGDYLYGRLHKITGGWRGAVEDYSVMLGGGVHMVDLMLWLSGERPRSVTCAGNRICTEGSGFAADDFQAATLQFDSGMVGRITANFGCVHRHHHVLRVFGTQASVLYDDAGARIHRSWDPAVPAEPVAEHPLPKGKGDLIPDFMDAVAGAPGYEQHTQSILDGIAVCLASDRAARSGKTEIIEYV